MIVTHQNFAEVLCYMRCAEYLSIDTETTGIKPYHDSVLFSIIVADEKDAYYFNFNQYPEITEGHEQLLTDQHIQWLKKFFKEHTCTYFIHNAKFDLAILRNAGIELNGRIHDTMTVARLLNSELMPQDFSLDACAKVIGEKKDDVVKRVIMTMKLYTEVGGIKKKGSKKYLHYQLVPFDIIVPYGEQDAKITFKLGMGQRAQFDILEREHAARRAPSAARLLEADCNLSRVVFEMESLGVKVDIDFCKRAITNFENRRIEIESKFREITGHDYMDSMTLFKEVFKDENLVMGEITPTGKQNPVFDYDVLRTFSHPAAKLVLERREMKNTLDFFHGFIEAADPQGVIHTNFNQHGAATGRFSSSNPNLQNLTKDEDEALSQEFVVRRAIVPRPGCVFHMLDYDQMEYRLMLDYAAHYAQDKEGVMALIDKVKGGLDVHQATADIAGITRKEAKTTNFSTLYGGGIKLLSDRLKVDERRAAEIRESIFRAAPEIKIFMDRVKLAAEKRGYLVNWMGRRYRFSNTRFSYKGPNYLIQGGCADIVKNAMILIHNYLKDKNTKLVLSIHDELVLEGPPEEVPFVVPSVREIMQTVYPHHHLGLTVGVDHSFKSLADKEEGYARV